MKHYGNSYFTIHKCENAAGGKAGRQESWIRMIYSKKNNFPNPEIALLEPKTLYRQLLAVEEESKFLTRGQVRQNLNQLERRLTSQRMGLSEVSHDIDTNAVHASNSQRICQSIFSETSHSQAKSA